MAGYEDTKQSIIDTLMGRPSGTEIQPENHQEYALKMLEYIRSIELSTGSPLIDIAKENTTPIQPNNSRVSYIAGISPDSKMTFKNFIGQDGEALSVTSGSNESFFIILLWNTEYWSMQVIPCNTIIEGGGGGDITVDKGLDEYSSNPIANSAVAKALKEIEKTLKDNSVVRIADLYALKEGEDTAAINSVSDFFGKEDLTEFISLSTQKNIIDFYGRTGTLSTLQLPPYGFRFFVKYYRNVSIDVSISTKSSGDGKIIASGVYFVKKYFDITWDDTKNANDYKDAGLYLIDGVHSNSGDNLPTTAYANGYIGGFMSVTVSTKDEELNEQIIGQNLTLSNKVSGETKQYIRSCIIKGDVETWSAWKEVNTIQMFGAKSSGIATKADIDAAIDNGQYAGVYMGSDGFLPQGATFTLTVINNYAATAASSLPANYRQITQIFIYTPLSTTGKVVPSKMVKRDGIGGDSISWSALESIGGSNEIKNGDIVLPDKTTMTLEDYKASKRSDAIGVVFDARKGLFVKKNKYTGVLIGNQDRATNIFYNVVRCKDPYDGKVTQKMNLLSSLYRSIDFPVFSYAEENGLYVASNGELAQMHAITDSLDAIGSDYGSMASIASCTQVPLATTRVSVFYGGAWEDRDTRDPLTSLSYFLIDIL